MKRVIALFAIAMVASLVVGCEKERNPEYYVLYFSARTSILRVISLAKSRFLTLLRE